MQDKRRKLESEMLRNTLTIRWGDAEHRAVVDEAWKRRMSASELVRGYVVAGLELDGVAVKDEAEPAGK